MQNSQQLSWPGAVSMSIFPMITLTSVPGPGQEVSCDTETDCNSNYTTAHSCSMLPISANIPTFNPMSGPPWDNVGLFLYISIDEF